MAVPRKAFSQGLKRLYDIIDGVTNPAGDGDSFLGTVATVTGLSVVEDGFGPFRRTTFQFDDVAFALVDEAGVVAYSGKKVYDFPAGNTLVLGATADFALTKSSAGVNADWDGDFGVGTVTASNNGTLAGTEQDIIPSTATPQAAAGATTAKGNNAAAIAPIVAGLTTDNDLFVNFLVDDADHDVTGTACNLIVNGTLVVIWMNLGNH
jgi:hypothetical protein